MVITDDGENKATMVVGLYMYFPLESRNIHLVNFLGLYRTLKRRRVLERMSSLSYILLCDLILLCSADLRYS